MQHRVVPHQVKKPLLASVELYSRIIITLANLFGLRLSHPSTGFEMISSKIYNVVPDATLICSIILAYLFDRNFPIIKIIPFPASLIGWLMIVWGIGLTLYILAILRSKHTSTDPTGIPSEFITDGLFSRSRNPLYLSYVIITMGTAFILGSLTAFVVPIVCFAILHAVIIPLEERNLQKKFGQEYEQYKHKVRRWI